MLYITNIPTPYRNYRFNKMSECLFKAGIELEVLYMNAAEPDRTWKIAPSDMQHQYQIFSDRTVRKKLGMWMHFSPHLQYYLSTTDYDIAVLGGLASPAHFIASLLLKKNKLNILSVESNIASIGNASSLATRVKAFLMNRFRYFQVTGEKSLDYIKYYIPNLDEKKVLTLPNIINEFLFDNASIKSIEPSVIHLIEEQKRQGNKVILTPARLIEEKGLIPFINCINEDDKLCLLIAGNGPLRSELERLIVDKNINVHLVGALQPSAIAGLMTSVDFLSLPSKSDPSPLSVIEALSVGLPIIASKNVGNYDEVIEEGVNGWGFEFENQEATRQALNTILTLPADKYKQARINARKIFQQRFSTQVVLQDYLDKVNKLIK